MSQRLNHLRTEFSKITKGIDDIEAAAKARGGDLTDAEAADVDKLYARAATLKPEIEAEAARVESIQAASQVLARVGGGLSTVTQGLAPALIRSTAEEKLPTPGEYMALMIRAKDGDTEASELLTRTVATMATGDTAGIIPVPILGPMIELANHLRPTFASLTPRPMPTVGKTFSRPQITQHVNVGQQAAELDELASRKMTIAGNTVTKMTLGGVLTISEQDIDWTDPAVLDIVVQDFVNMYAEATEAKAIAALVALATTDSPYDDTSIATIISSFMTAITTCYAAAKRKPDTCWLALDAALTLAGTVNPTTDVSALTLLRQALNDGNVPLEFVTAPGLASGTMIIGAKSLAESYEQRKGLLSAPDVSHLGVNIAYRGYAAFFGLAAGFVNLAAA
jgi:HK97 family phage major capsid protein